MPMLDAKALEIDPKGMAFLLSVLRQNPVVTIQPKGLAPRRRLPQNVRMHFRLTRRSKELLSNPV